MHVTRHSMWTGVLASHFPRMDSDADVLTFGRRLVVQGVCMDEWTDVCDGGRDGACREEVSMIARLWTRRRGD